VLIMAPNETNLLLMGILERIRKSAVLCFLFIICSFNIWGANYYVNDNSTTGDIFTSAVGNSSNDGLTAATPMASLTEIWTTYGPSGTNVITSGDVIFLDAGTYLALDANLALSVSGISITGAGSEFTFFDNDLTSTDANRWATITGNNITITGIYLTGYNYGLGDANVIQIDGATNLTLNDVIVNENLPGGGSSSIVITGASSVDFINGGSSCNPGSASVAGGGVNIEGNGNDVSFLNYTFSANTKDYQGGSALRITGDATTTVDIDNCIFNDNENSSAEGGGAIFIANGASITIDGSCFNNNTANQVSSVNYGGAITVGRGSNATINNCSFDGNSATSSGNGGAISINTGLGNSGTTATVNVSNSSFSNNSGNDGADIHGRVSFSRAAVHNINECSFSGTAEDIRNDNSASITVANSGSPSISGTVNLTNTIPTSTSPITNCPSTPTPCFSVLPVSFNEFTIDCIPGVGIEFQWSTFSELNNDYFRLEKSTDGVNYITVTTVNGAGSTSTPSNYFYLHRELDGPAYYRLSQTDFDGKRTVLKTVFSANCTEENALFTHHFNQNTASIEIIHQLELEKAATVTIVTSSGAVILKENINLSPQTGTSTIQLQRVPETGVYFIWIQTEDVSYQGRILILE